MRPTLPLLACACLFCPTRAAADDVDAELISKALHGKSKPALVLTINKPVQSITLELTRNDGEPLRRTTGALRAGTVQRFELPTPVGTWRFKGTLTVRFQNGSGGAMPLDLEVETSGPFVVDSSYERLRLDKGELDVTLSRPAGRCEHEVTIEDKPVRQGQTSFAGEPPGTWLTISWRRYAADDVVLKIRLICWDKEEAFHTDPFELYPWWLEIPHEDVTFETGRWEIRPTERPKLDTAYAEIDKAVRRYGAIVAVKLYVVGHTDTVGDPASNRELSQNRARALAAYFRQRGVTIPIHVLGRGEDALAVPTPDQTDEPRNRRAEYIIGVEAPYPASWRPL